MDVKKEKAILVGFKHRVPSGHALDSILELEQLAVTSGAEVLEKVLQRERRISPKFFYGEGIVAELASLVEAHQADLVICDDELSPAQTRNIEKEVGVKVVDRTGIILDIFAKRAKTRAGALQVELAQLSFLLPRLVGRGVMLSRLGAGIGTRGPGETKLEVDRRRIRQRITHIKQELQKVIQTRELHREKRQAVPVPVVSIVGYTNAGKTTLMNSLTGTHLWASNQLFATLDPTTRRVRLPNGTRILLTDTVGFIQKLPHQLIEAFKATLEEIVQSDLLIHVVDLHNPFFERQIDEVALVLESIGAGDIPILTIYNKIDLEQNYRKIFLESRREMPSVLFSAKTGEGMDELLEKMQQALLSQYQEITLAFPLESRGKKLGYQEVMHEVYQGGSVLEQKFTPSHCIARVLVTKKMAARLKKRRAPSLEHQWASLPKEKKA